MRPWHLCEVKYSYVKDHPYEVAVLPVGAIEPHNLHLPYGTDTITTERLGDLACARAHERGARVALLPALAYGVDTNLLGFPMAMSVRPSTLDRLIGDLVDSLAAHGLRKLVLLNGHGGNSLKNTLRELFGRTPVFLSLIDWYAMGKDLYPTLFSDPGDHAGEMETSVGLHLFPELVELGRADDGAVHPCRLEAVRRGWVQITRPWHLATTHSGVGDPRRATAEKGARLVAELTERIAGYLVELAAAEMDERFPY